MDNPYPNKVDTEIIIDMSNNRLTQTSSFGYAIFEDLMRPTKLLLNQNDFNNLPPAAFQRFLNKRGSLIDISNNFLICDCQSVWLRSMAILYENKVINYNCLNLNNSSIFKVEKSLCENGLKLFLNWNTSTLHRSCDLSNEIKNILNNYDFVSLFTIKQGPSTLTGQIP